ncbi:TRAP transporter small permease [Pseudoruegeria sp. SHC-113]|uniref:TRAP transporter small permease n=1 Tax=Pseudoruegeria sp. SHC-113 TaxID=2855439 RepID=UPI0021BB660A|nr:TRAP transporter small permease [Pseudoruegeria sp. SHC-113]MCT8160908.1 TRAP transporter small permease [Pseudoruegeria sp. SHC-113]
MTVLAQTDRILGRVLRGLPILCLSALFMLLLVNVIARLFKLAGFAWFDEIVQGLFAWMVFSGAAALWREKDHFQVDWLPMALPPARRRALQILTGLLSLGFLAAMTWYGLQLTLKATALTPILDLPVRLFYLAIPLSGAVMLMYSLADLIRLVLGPPALETSHDL